MKNNIIDMEQEVHLAPKKEKIKNAEKIAESSLNAEKYPFIISYDAIERNSIIAELRRIGCEEMKQLDFANCIVVSMSAEQLKAIKTFDGVEKVEKDYDYKCLTKDVNATDNATILASEISELDNGTTIKLALLDTGVSKDLIKGFVDFVNDSEEDETGHGTQMAGIISAVVANADDVAASPSVYSAVVADHNGFAKTSTIMQALDWAINNKINVVCMCFGDYHKSELLENMINRAFSCGIVMIAPVGNDGGFEKENRIMYPAAFSNVISVGATSGENVAHYSNGKASADCYACGSQITTDIAGNALNVIGTSAAAAFVAGTILKKWSAAPDKNPDEIVKEIKVKTALSVSNVGTDSLTSAEGTDIINENDEYSSWDIAKQKVRSSYISTDLDGEGVGGNNECFCNDMASAITIPFIYWQHANISCPCNEVWYKFTANVGTVHANGSTGKYVVRTDGDLDTVGYLYDCHGNLVAYNDDNGSNLNFSFWVELNYSETYYIRVKAHGNNTGNFRIQVSYFDDDHGNTMDTATEISDVYYEDKSITGDLHSKNDVDYYTFVPARNCVMEIYTEGDTDTYGRLYNASEELIDSDNDSNGNGNFKITAHLEAMKRYYIAVSHNSANGYGDYTLRFKFIKDYSDQFVNEQYRVMYWFADNQGYPELYLSAARSRAFVSDLAKAEFEDRIILAENNEKSGLRAVLDSGIYQDILDYLLDNFVSLISEVASSLILVLGLGFAMYDFMHSLDVFFYRRHKSAIENTDKYIIGEHCLNTSPDYLGLPTFTNRYFVGSGTYYGSEYERGVFIETYIKS